MISVAVRARPPAAVSGPRALGHLQLQPLTSKNIPIQTGGLKQGKLNLNTGPSGLPEALLLHMRQPMALFTNTGETR